MYTLWCYTRCYSCDDVSNATQAAEEHDKFGLSLN